MNLNELTTALQLLLKDTKSGGMSKKVRASNLCEVFKEIYAHIPGSDFSNEKIYLCLNGLKDIPKSSCGNHSRFINVENGYNEYCILPKQGPGFCSHCRTIIDSRKDYSKNGFKSDKFKQVMLEKYGVENISQTPEQKEFLRSICKFNDEAFKKETEQKLIDKFGSIEGFHQHLGSKTSEHYNNLSSEEMEVHAQKTSLGRIKKTYLTKIKGFKKINPKFEIDSYVGGERKYKYDFECTNCNKTFSVNVYEKREPRCPNCDFNESISMEEQGFCEFITSLLPQETPIIRNDRIIISPYEVDMFIPSLNIAFEYNGLYWHQEKYAKKDKHQQKVIKCREKGIKLITVFSDDWKFKKDIVKNRIKSFLSMNTSLYARKCNLSVIGTSAAQEFLETYHIQGYCPSSLKYGLYFNNELQAVMTFGASRYNKNYQWELLRYASKGSITGGVSKLLKHFIQNNSPASIISYADLSYGFGDVYTKVGFSFKGLTAPDYSYVHTNKEFRENRMKFQKHKLVQEGYPEELSEADIMKLKQYYKVYGCGNAIYEWRKENGN